MPTFMCVTSAVDAADGRTTDRTSATAQRRATPKLIGIASLPASNRRTQLAERAGHQVEVCLDRDALVLLHVAEPYGRLNDQPAAVKAPAHEPLEGHGRL